MYPHGHQGRTTIPCWIRIALWFRTFLNVVLKSTNALIGYVCNDILCPHRVTPRTGRQVTTEYLDYHPHLRHVASFSFIFLEGPSFVPQHPPYKWLGKANPDTQPSIDQRSDSTFANPEEQTWFFRSQWYPSQQQYPLQQPAALSTPLPSPPRGSQLPSTPLPTRLQHLSLDISENPQPHKKHRWPHTWQSCFQARATHCIA